MKDNNKLDLLRRTGEALYGPHWQSDLARALGVNLRSLQRWGAGNFQPPAGIWPELAALLTARREELAALARETRKVAELQP